MQAQPEQTGRILVPLDGSPLAEHALPLAEHLAVALRCPLLLVRVVSIPAWEFSLPGAPETYQDMVNDADRATRDYLAAQADIARRHVPWVGTQMLYGEPASSLLDFCTSHPEVSLVVMTSHGRTGLARFALGSVADRLERYGHTPVLALRSFANFPATLERAVVPLDGSTRAEEALRVVPLLAGEVIPQIDLVQVVAESATGEEVAAAHAYLDTVRQRLAREATHVITATVLRGTVAEQIVDYAAAHHAVIALASRGQTGAVRWPLGGVADRILHNLRVTTLLVPASEP